MKEKIKVSLIIATYKDVEALELIIESLKIQTYKNFEAIIAEDGEDEKIARFVSSISGISFKHITQEDLGVRKTKAQNEAIRISDGEYLIFIDGDCIPYHDFIEKHILLSDEKYIISSRRANLGKKYSSKLRSKEISSLWLEKNYIKNYIDIAMDSKEERHAEDGIKIKPFGLIHKALKFRKKELSLLGCNFSCYKSAMVAINGFNEDLGDSAFATDGDLEWRFYGLGYKTLSARFIANQFHLWHQRINNSFTNINETLILKNKNKKQYRCQNGLYD